MNRDIFSAKAASYEKDGHRVRNVDYIVSASVARKPYGDFPVFLLTARR